MWNQLKGAVKRLGVARLMPTIDKFVTDGRSPSTIAATIAATIAHLTSLGSDAYLVGLHNTPLTGS